MKLVKSKKLISGIGLSSFTKGNETANKFTAHERDEEVDGTQGSQERQGDKKCNISRKKLIDINKMVTRGLAIVRLDIIF